MTTTTQQDTTKATPKNGAPDPAAAAKNTALAKKQQEELLPAGVNEPALNKAVKEVSDLKGAGAAVMWELGKKIREIHDGQLWKARQNEDKSMVYKHWNAFCVSELKMTPTHAYNLMDISKAFSQAHVKQWGVAKLALVLKAPEEDQPRLLQESAKHSARELADKVTKLRKEKGTKKRVTGRKPMPEGKPGAIAATKAARGAKETITIAALLEKNHTVALYARPEKRGEEPSKRAKHLRDVPLGWLDLPNGVRQTIVIGANPTTGELVAKVTFKRHEE